MGFKCCHSSIRSERKPQPISFPEGTPQSDKEATQHFPTGHPDGTERSTAKGPSQANAPCDFYIRWPKSFLQERKSNLLAPLQPWCLFPLLQKIKSKNKNKKKMNKNQILTSPKEGRLQTDPKCPLASTRRLFKKAEKWPRGSFYGNFNFPFHLTFGL